MNKQDVMEAVTAALAEFGVPEHCFSVKAVPAQVEVQLVAGGGRMIVNLRSGITRPELDLALSRLGAHADRRGTVDLEEVIGK